MYIAVGGPRQHPMTEYKHKELNKYKCFIDSMHSAHQYVRKLINIQ